jgi:adenylosuccinate synthase
LPGWNTDLTRITNAGEFPQKLRDYIRFIENETGVPVTIASVGPDRNQTIRIRE